MARCALSRLGLIVSVIVAATSITELCKGQFHAPESWKKDPNHRFKNRYEGLLATPTAANPTSLMLLSFTGAFTPFSGKEIWQVRFYAPASFDPARPSKAVVSARDVSDNYQYWMESFERQVHGWDTFEDWNTADVLVPRGIRPSIVGILVSLNGSLDNIAPAFVFPTSQPLPANLSVDWYNLRLRSEVRIDQVAYRLSESRPSRNVEGTSTVNTLGESVFLVKLDVRSFREGPVSVKVRGLRKGTMVAACDFGFFHKKSVP